MTAPRLTPGLFVATLLAVGRAADADLVVGGDITSSATWALADSPILVESSVTVKSGAILTIDPGVEVRFAPGTRLRVGPPGSSATLVARGELGVPILFTASAESAEPGAWAGVLLDGSAVDAIHDAQGYVSGSILEHCVVEYGGGDTAAPGAVRAVSSYPYLNQCEVRWSATIGIALMGDSPSLKSIRVEACDVHHNGVTLPTDPDVATGLHVFGGKNHLIRGCTIHDNFGGGLTLHVCTGTLVKACAVIGNGVATAALHSPYCDGLTIESTIIADNDATGMELYGAGVVATGCTISGNTGEVVGGVMLRSDITLEKSAIVGNSGSPVPWSTGGVRGLVQGTVRGCTISGNMGGTGGVTLDYHGTLQNNVITDNIGESDGGGVRLGGVGGPASTITGNVIENNSAAGRGGGAMVNGAAGFSANTIRNNVAAVSGGGLQVTAAGVNLAGSVGYVGANSLVDNIAPLGAAICHEAASPAEIDASFVDWGTIDPVEVESRIHDFLDNGALGLVVIAPIPSPVVVRDAVWDLASSPRSVETSVLVAGGATLTIEPGVEVRFAPGMGLAVGHPVLGAGTLLARGTEAAPIRFTSDRARPQPGDWAGIRFADEAVDAVVDREGMYVSGSILEDCVVEYAGSDPGLLLGAVTIHAASPLLRECEIRLNRATGVHFNGSPWTGPSLRIDSCSIHGNIFGPSELPGPGVAGGFALVGGHGHRVVNCTVHGNLGYLGGGGLIQNVGECAVEGCTIAGNAGIVGGGLALDTADALVTGNLIEENFAFVSGGGLWSDWLPGVVTSNEIRGNVAVSTGGAVIDGDNALVTGNVIADNVSFVLDEYSAGGLFLVGKNSVIEDNEFRGNLGNAGGLMVYEAQFTRVSGNSFVENVAYDGGGGIRIRAKDVDFVGNLVRANQAGFGGGVLLDPTSAGTTLAGAPESGVVNTIVDNVAAQGSALFNSRLYAAGGANDMPAQYVCWGTSDLELVAAMIHDHADAPSVSAVLYEPVATDCPPAERPRDPDIDGDGEVDGADLGLLLSAWGPCPARGDCPADLDGDTVVGGADLAVVLGAWGT